MNNAFLSILVALDLCAIFSPQILLGRDRELTGNQLRNVTPQSAVIGKWYPFLQIIWAVIVALAYLGFGISLKIVDGHRQAGLALSALADIATTDGITALWTHIYPLPDRFGYRYIFEDSKRLRMVAILQLCLVAATTVLAVSWSMGVW